MSELASRQVRGAGSGPEVQEQMRELKMKLELELDVEAVVSAVREELGDVPTEDEVRDIAREEAESAGGGLDEEGVTEHATSLLNSVPENESGLCTLGNAFQGALNKVLAMPATVEVLKEALGLEEETVPASGENDEPFLALEAIKGRDSGKILHLSPTYDEAQALADSSDRHGQHVTVQVPLSIARRVLNGELGCSAREVQYGLFRLVPNAVYARVEYDDGTIARCGEVVRQFVADQDRQPVTAECWVVVFGDRSVSGPYASQEEARRYQAGRAAGMDTVVRQATLAPGWQ